MKKQTVAHLIFGGYNLVLILCILVVATCNSACFVHRHQQSQTATADTASTHQETEAASWIIDTTSLATRHDESESTVEVEFDSSGGYISPSDYFPPIQGRVKKMVLKTKASVITLDSSAKKTAGNVQRAAADSNGKKTAAASSSRTVSRFNVTGALLILLLLVLVYLLYRNRRRITTWIIGNGMLP